MAYIIKAVGIASDFTVFIKDMWVESYDLDALPVGKFSTISEEGAVINGLFGGVTTLTIHREKAKVFSSLIEGLGAWTETSKTRPTRPDGKPNKPMTAISVMMEPL